MAHPRSDRGYGLVLRRTLVALHHILDYVRFVAAVVLDRLGVAPFEGEMLRVELVDTAAMERLMEAEYREPSWSLMKKRSSTAPQYRRLRVAPAEDSEADDDDGSEAICAICLAALHAGEHRIAELCNCPHKFHAACIENWIAGGEAGTCPLCRTPAIPTARSGWLA